MGITVLVIIIVVIVATIIINVIGFVRDRRFQKKNKGVYMLAKKMREYAHLANKSEEEVLTSYLVQINNDIQHLDNAQSGGGINN